MIKRKPKPGELRQRLKHVLTHPHGQQVDRSAPRSRRRQCGASHGVVAPSTGLRGIDATYTVALTAPPLFTARETPPNRRHCSGGSRPRHTRPGRGALVLAHRRNARLTRPRWKQSPAQVDGGGREPCFRPHPSARPRAAALLVARQSSRGGFMTALGVTRSCGLPATVAASGAKRPPSFGRIWSLLCRWAGRDPTCLLRLRRRQEQPPRRATYRHRSYQTPRVEAGPVSAGNGRRAHS